MTQLLTRYAHTYSVYLIAEEQHEHQNNGIDDRYRDLLDDSARDNYLARVTNHVGNLDLPPRPQEVMTSASTHNDLVLINIHVFVRQPNA